MKNINEFKKEYLKYKEKMYEIDKLLEENVNDFLKVKKNIDFIYLEYENDEIVKDIIDALGSDEIPDMKKLEAEYTEYITHLSSKVHERLELYDKRIEIIDTFEKYMYKNNVTYWDIEKSWEEEVKKYKSKWYGWSSNELICQSMYQTIHDTNEDEINTFIENAKKVMELIDNRSYSISIISDLEFINKYLRHDEGYDGCEHVFILDGLENDCMWNIYKEPFIRFVQKLSHCIDSDYLDYLKDIEMEDMYSDLED